MKNYLAIIVLLFLIGCGGSPVAPSLNPSSIQYPQVTYSATSVSVDGLIDIITEKTGCPATYEALNYNLPTKDWFFNDYATALKDMMIKQNTFIYRKEIWDCSAFALESMMKAKKDNLFTTNAPKCDMAVGVISYVQTDVSASSHAIVFALVKENGKTNMYFLEPQTCKEVYLFPEQIASSIFVIF